MRLLCSLLLLTPILQTTPFHFAPPRPTPTQTMPLFSSSISPEQTRETLSKVWKSRRKIIRSTLSTATAIRTELAPPEDDDDDDEENTPESVAKQTLALTTFTAVAASVIIRVGGRGAIIGGLGVAPPETFDSGPFPDIYNAISNLHCTDPESYVSAVLLLLPIWIFLRVFMLDYVAIPIAFLAGITFNNVLLGAAITSTLSMTGSSVGFLLARYTPWGAKACEKITNSNPAVRGVNKLVVKEPIKTVFTARLAPLLPIPIGGYNYIYGGLTSIRYADFALGTWLGGLKPYLLDAYLGKLSFEITGGADSLRESVDDWVLVAVVAVAVGVGALASNMVGEGWEEVKSEIEAEERRKKLDPDPDPNDDDWLAKFRLPWADEWEAAEEKIMKVVQREYELKLFEEEDPLAPNPALEHDAPENADLSLASLTMESVAFSIIMFSVLWKYGDPKSDVDTGLELLVPW
ncbi:hypothetical protein TrLO_g15020 [Triparma laevis f. longispina]|uniref:VTT domain-containing protein n=2 Tax=Triparma laevis f. longispina TaxID=1714387 RepID=A0A9W7E1X6_9STRA|nr:hypothetical protein TrLO_g15020 [Triparma laevis f. longispina]